MNIQHVALIALGSLCTAACQSSAPQVVAGEANPDSPSASQATPDPLCDVASPPGGADMSTDLEAAAQSTDDAADARRWRHVATLYGWVPNLKGDVTVRGLDSEPSISRSDVLDNLDIAFSGRYEVQPPDSDWSFYGDVFYAAIADDGSADTAAVGRIDADFESRMTFVEAGAAMHGWQSDETAVAYARETSRTKVDVLGGVRYSRVRLKVDLKAKAIGARKSFDESDDWTDPFVGARVRHGLTPRLWLIGRGTIGGFDVGSHRTWTATGTLQYLLSEQWAVGAGWRVMDIDYDDGPDLDIRMSGPFVTLSYDF